jgi:flagellar assembly protein FliH
MSSKIVSGDSARAAQGINWSRRAPLYAEHAQAATQRDSTSPARGFETDSDLDTQIADARRMGRVEGEQAMQAQMSAQVDTMHLRVARALEELALHKSALRREAEEDVVKLAIAIARKVIYREISVDSEALLGLVKVALEKIEARELHRVRVHPEQVACIEHALKSIGAPRQIEVHGDPGLERGAAIFETARGSLDASVDTQLRQIERGFADVVARR